MAWNEDRYKSEGNITFKIEKFAEFARENEWSQRLSDAVYIEGRAWRIVAKVGKCSADGKKKMYCFLQCKANQSDFKWVRLASMAMKIIAQTEGKKNYEKVLIGDYYSDEETLIASLSFEQLMAPENGWYLKTNDTLTIWVDLKTDAAILDAQNKELRAALALEKERISSAEKKVREMGAKLKAKESAECVLKEQIKELRAALAREKKVMPALIAFALLVLAMLSGLF